MTERNVRTLTALLLVLAAMLILASALLGSPWPRERSGRNVYLLADRSSSVVPGRLADEVAEVVSQVTRGLPDAEIRIVDFAVQPMPARPLRRGKPEDLESRIDASARNATNIASALRSAHRDAGSDAGHGVSEGAAFVLLSDGNATTGDTRKELEAIAAAGFPLLWQSVPVAIEAPRILEVRTPPVAVVGQQVPALVRLAGSIDRPLELSVAARGTDAQPVTVGIEPGQATVSMPGLGAVAAGPLVLDATLRDSVGAVIDDGKSTALVDVRPRASILYLADGSRPLERSLRAGGWDIELAAPARLDELSSQFGSRAAVILDDVSIGAAREATWKALLEAVREDGTGLLVLGGPRSFAAGAYRGSLLESALPVLSRPAALGDGTAIVFAVDKSGSMGASAAGIDRFALAQRAVVESAQSLTERDSAAVVVFDVEARTVVPLQPARTFQGSVARAWPVQPRGGTSLAPAMDAVLEQFEAAGAARKILVLVTDGFVGDVPIDTIRDRLSRAGVEVVALAIGPDADVGALRGLAATDQLTILRVAEAAELPSLMRQGLETRRAPVQRSPSVVRIKESLPFLDKAVDALPVVAAYAVTTAREDAVTYLESELGDPLLASRQFGSGRVVAVTPGLGAWTPRWLAWPGWPAFAGGLVDWSGRNTAVARSVLRVTELPGRLHVSIDAAHEGRWSAPASATLSVRRPSGRREEMPMRPEGPGRLGAAIADPEPGLHEFTVTSAGGTSRGFHLHQPLRELDRTGPNPEFADWERERLLQRWSPAAIAQLAAKMQPRDRPPAKALALALLLLVAAVLVDRAGRRR